jgi:hypothetical protein
VRIGGCGKAWGVRYAGGYVVCIRMLRRRDILKKSKPWCGLSIEAAQKTSQCMSSISYGRNQATRIRNASVLDFIKRRGGARREIAEKPKPPYFGQLKI